MHSKKRPEFRLPRALRCHPLLEAVDRLARQGMSTHTIARDLRISRQALFQMIVRARANRDYAFPPHHVPTICRLARMEPYYFNPELWKREWRF